LRLARRSQERQHPVGIRFGEGQALAELLRADNDVPTQLWEEGSDIAYVLFEGHDGVFHLQPDHPDFGRIHALLGEAIRLKARVWFFAQKPGLALLDVMAAGRTADTTEAAGRREVTLRMQISFVSPTHEVVAAADAILRANIRCTPGLHRDIRAVAKACIDEADELKRAAKEIQTNADRVQLQTNSPPETVEKARRLQETQLANKSLQEKVRKVAKSYVVVAEKNQQLFDEFMKKYGDILPPAK
jgi:hypothetical protein